MKEDLDFDENCDPENPRKIKYDDILAAGRRVVGGVVRTPCFLAHMSEKLGMEIYLKAEYLQFTGCFKERGVYNALMVLTEEQKKYGVVSATTGNHGLAVSYHATKLNIPCVVVLATSAAINKIMKCEKYGAKVIQHGSNFEEARRFAIGLAKEKKMVYINGYDHPNVIEGQGTVGLEILEQVPGLDAVLIPVGGGSLLAGVGVAVKHLKPDTEIYGLETEKTNSMVESLRKNERVYMNMGPSLANALAVPTVGINSFHTIKGLVDKMVVVREDWVARAIMHLMEDERCVVEGAGAVGVAAIMAGLFPNLKGKKVVVIASGGNIEPIVMGRALEHGMACEGRLVKFSVKTSDRLTALADITALLANVGVTIRDCEPERTWVKGDVFSRKYKLLVETRGWDHTKELAESVKKHFPDSVFPDMAERPDKASSARRGPCLAPNPVCMQK